MPTLTYPTLTADQTRGVTFALAKHNAELAARKPAEPPITAHQYMVARLLNIVDSFSEAAKLDRRTRLRAKFDSLTTVQQDAILTQLGLPLE